MSPGLPRCPLPTAQGAALLLSCSGGMTFSMDSCSPMACGKVVSAEVLAAALDLQDPWTAPAGPARLPGQGVSES